MRTRQNILRTLIGGLLLTGWLASQADTLYQPMVSIIIDDIPPSI